jgi:hypothetical protein
MREPAAFGDILHEGIRCIDFDALSAILVQPTEIRSMSKCVATEEEARLLEHGIRWETQFLEWWTKGKISTALLSFVHL